MCRVSLRAQTLLRGVINTTITIVDVTTNNNTNNSDGGVDSKVPQLHVTKSYSPSNEKWWSSCTVILLGTFNLQILGKSKFSIANWLFLQSIIWPLQYKFVCALLHVSVIEAYWSTITNIGYWSHRYQYRESIKYNG